MNRYALIMLISLLAVSCYCCSDTGEAREVRISFTGDIMMHAPVKTCAAMHNKLDTDNKTSLNNGGFNYLFERIKGPLRPSDIVVGNMEFPVSPPFTSRYRNCNFNCSPDILGALKWAGFNMLTIANNHILDQGDQGAVNSMQFLEQYKIDFIGVGATEPAARWGIVKTVNGIRIGFLAYTGYLNFPVPKKQTGYHLNWIYNKDEVREDIESIKKRCDYLVMVAHTGIEYKTLPRTSDIEMYRKFINYGADLIIGHHPHVLQPAEKVMANDGRACYIFYSLGNFISNQSTKAASFFDGAPLTTRDAVIIRCIVKWPLMAKRPESAFEVVPVYTDNILERSPNLRSIQTVSINQELGILKKKLSGADSKEKVDIERQIQNLYQKLKAIRLALFGANTIKEVTLIENSSGHDR